MTVADWLRWGDGAQRDPTQLEFFTLMGAVDGVNVTADLIQWTRAQLQMLETLGASHSNFRCDAAGLADVHQSFGQLEGCLGGCRGE